MHVRGVSTCVLTVWPGFLMPLSSLSGIFETKGRWEMIWFGVPRTYQTYHRL